MESFFTSKSRKPKLNAKGLFTG